MIYFDEAEDPQYFTARKMPIFAYSSQAHGYITKILNGRPLSDAVRRSYDSPHNRERAKRAGVIAEKSGCSAEAVGLGFIFSQAFPVFAIVGSKNMSQLKSSLEAANIELSPEDISYLQNNGI